MVYECELCGRRFASFEAYMEHKLIGLCSAHRSVFKCPGCGARFTSLKRALAHVVFCPLNNTGALLELGPTGVHVWSREDLRRELSQALNSSPGS